MNRLVIQRDVTREQRGSLYSNKLQIMQQYAPAAAVALVFCHPERQILFPISLFFSALAVHTACFQQITHSAMCKGYNAKGYPRDSAGAHEETMQRSQQLSYDRAILLEIFWKSLENQSGSA